MVSNQTIPDEKMVGLIDLKRDQTEFDSDDDVINTNFATPVNHEGSFAYPSNHKHNKVFIENSKDQDHLDTLEVVMAEVINANENEDENEVQMVRMKPPINFSNQESIDAEILYAPKDDHKYGQKKQRHYTDDGFGGRDNLSDNENMSKKHVSFPKGMDKVKSTSAGYLDESEDEQSSDSESSSQLFETATIVTPHAPQDNMNFSQKMQMEVEKEEDKRSSMMHYVDTRGEHIADIVMNIEDNEYDFGKSGIGSIVDEELDKDEETFL